MSHPSLSEYYERRFAEQGRGAGAGDPPPSFEQPTGVEWLREQVREVAALACTGQLDEPNDWLEDHVRAGNMRRVTDAESGEHYEWIGTGPPPHQEDIPCSPPYSVLKRRKAALMASAREAVLGNPIGRAWRARLTEADFHRICEMEVERFLRGADSTDEQMNPEPDPSAGALSK